MKKIIMLSVLFLGMILTINAQPPNPQPRQGCALFNFYVGFPTMAVFTVHSNQSSNITLPMVGDWTNATIEIYKTEVYPANWAICLNECNTPRSVSATSSPHINTVWYLKPGHASAQAYYTVRLIKAGCPTDEEPIRYVLILP